MDFIFAPPLIQKAPLFSLCVTYEERNHIEVYLKLYSNIQPMLFSFITSAKLWSTKLVLFSLSAWRHVTISLPVYIFYFLFFTLVFRVCLDAPSYYQLIVNSLRPTVLLVLCTYKQNPTALLCFQMIFTIENFTANQYLEKVSCRA